MITEGTFLGLNLAVVLAIVGISQKLKETVKAKPKNKVWLNLYPLSLSALFGAFLTQPFEWQQYGFNVLIYTGMSVLFYDAVIQYIERKKESLR